MKEVFTWVLVFAFTFAYIFLPVIAMPLWAVSKWLYVGVCFCHAIGMIYFAVTCNSGIEAR